nr:Hok/Gef family protein [Escherichia coli]
MLVICPPAVGAALETKKALCEVHTRTGQGGVVFFPAYESE